MADLLQELRGRSKAHLSKLTPWKRTKRQGKMPGMIIKEDIDLCLSYNSLSFNLSLITCLQLWLSIYCTAPCLSPRAAALNETASYPPIFFSK